MDKRQFLKTSGILGAGIVIAPAMACKKREVVQTVESNSNAVYTQEPLGYAFNALEPHIDALTMEIHYTKHHMAYINNLNNAVKGLGYTVSIEELCFNLDSSAENATAIRNNGGGHYNHTKFWNWIAPGGKNTPSEELMADINRAFGNYESFLKAFSDAAKSRFGSGWAWLIVKKDGSLAVTSTPNQDNPLMRAYVPGFDQGVPILGLDVWEHAYYLHYQNKRADYITAFFNIINWTQVEADWKKAAAK